MCDALGNPLRFIVTAGQRHDCTQAIALLEGLKAGAALGDKGYDTDAFLAALEVEGIVAIIPPKSNRIVQREIDEELYKERHKIECLFGFLKHYRRLFARFEKLKQRLESFLHFAAALQWLK